MSPFYRQHRKVWLWWNAWLALQFVSNEWFSFGVHMEPSRPLLDLFLGPLTVSVGHHPILTDERWKHRHSGRGFLYHGEEPPV